MKKILAILLLINAPIFAWKPTDQPGERAYIFATYGLKPVDISNGEWRAPYVLTGRNKKIYTAILNHYEEKNGYTLHNGCGDFSLTVVALIKDNTVYFSTTDNSGGPLASGVVMNGARERLGILKRKRGHWEVIKEQERY